jgi:hypothetical protein
MEIKNKNNIIFLLLIIISIYFYSKINSSNIPDSFIIIYKNPLFKIIFLLLLYFYGNYNIPLTLFLAINYIGLGQIIQHQELMENI